MKILQNELQVRRFGIINKKSDNYSSEKYNYENIRS